jgi:hypothetical protein
MGFEPQSIVLTQCDIKRVGLKKLLHFKMTKHFGAGDGIRTTKRCAYTMPHKKSGFGKIITLQNDKTFWSGRWDSNPRPQPWQGCALPLSYARIIQ